MGGPTSGRYITLKPDSRAAEKIVTLLLKEDALTCEQLALKFGVSLSAFSRYLKGDRAMPLWLAVDIEKQLKIPVEEWLKKLPKRAAA